MTRNLAGKKILLAVATRDFRDEEYFVPKEIFEDAKIEVKTASNAPGTAIGADGGNAIVDFLLSEVNPADFEAIVFIGGPGCLENLDNQENYRLCRETISQNKLLAAICIAPVILAKAGVLKNKKATIWSSPLQQTPVEILRENGAEYINKAVVADGKIITANGPAAAKEFGKRIVESLAAS